MTSKYIRVEDLQKFCDNQKDHCITPNDFQRFNTIEIKEPHGNWHTGTPTEEGWYLLALTTKVFNDNPFCVAYMDGHHWLGIDDFCIFVDHVLAWQKIEPYRG